MYFGVYNPDLVDIILAVKAKAAQHQDVRDDEMLIDLLEQTEALTLGEATDRHEDTSPLTGRWIAEPPAQGAGHHVVHEVLTMGESTSRWEQDKGYYSWA